MQAEFYTKQWDTRIWSEKSRMDVNCVPVQDCLA